MQAPSLPPDEAARLRDLRGYEVLDSQREEAFDRLTRLASAIFDVPIAMVSLVDEARQWFKSEHGLDAVEAPRDVSFCGHAVLQNTPMVVNDATHDTRFADNPFVTGNPNVRFYAGAPLTTTRGHNIGTLCLIDRKPRELSALQQQVLSDLAAMVVDQLELRRTRIRAEQETQQVSALLSALSVPVLVVSDEHVAFANKSAATLFGRAVQGIEFKTLFGGGDAPPDQPAERWWFGSDNQQHLVTSVGVRLRWQGSDAVVVSLQDVGAERRSAVRRMLELQQLADIFSRLPEGIVIYDANNRPAYLNAAIEDVFQLTLAEITAWDPARVADHVASLVEDPNDARERMRGMRAKAMTGEPAQETFTFVKPRHRVMRRTLYKLDIPERPWLTLWTDVTHETEALKRSQVDASTDVLTQLPNRRAAEAALVGALTAGATVSLVLFDVDHFKKVNDTFGHDVGDEVLQAVAKALASAARAGDLVCRWGGEEFVAVLKSDVPGAEKFAERARLAVEKAATAAGAVTVSGGVTAVKHLTDVKLADERLYEAKKSGRNRIVAT